MPWIKNAAIAATAIGGLLHAIKGAVLLIDGADLSLVPAMVTLFALGLVGFSLLISDQPRVAARIGLVLSGAAVVAGIVSLLYQVAGIAPEDFGSPTGVQIAYGVGTFAILVGLLAIAISAFSEGSLARSRRIALLVAATVWFPLEGLTEVAPDGWGLLCAGLAWLVVPFCFGGRLAFGGPTRD